MGSTNLYPTHAVFLEGILVAYNLRQKFRFMQEQVILILLNG